MRTLIAALVLLALPGAALAGTPAEDKAACIQRQPEVAKKIAEFKGDEQSKLLMLADLQRASREQAEGDDDECVEALDHAELLLAGKE